RLLPKIELEAHSVDPFEEELDELDPADGAPRHAAVAHANGTDRGTGYVADTRTLPPPSPTTPQETRGSRGGEDPAHAALEVLRATVEQRDDYRIRYEQALSELADLQHRHHALLDA